MIWILIVRREQLFSYLLVDNAEVSFSLSEKNPSHVKKKYVRKWHCLISVYFKDFSNNAKNLVEAKLHLILSLSACLTSLV